MQKMKLKKCVTVITAGSILAASIGGDVTAFAAMGEAAQEQNQEVCSEKIANEEVVNEDIQTADAIAVEQEVETEETTETSQEVLLQNEAAVEEDEETEETEEIEISDVKAEYNEKTNQITLTWSMQENASVKIYVNNKLEEENYKRTAYVYEVPQEGMNYTFEVVPANEDVGEEVTVSVGYRAAVLEQVNVEYDLEKKILVVDWEGENIAYADVYQDDVLLAEMVSGDKLSTELSLEALSTHTYKVIPYNANKEASEAKTVQYIVDDYIAKVESLTVDYQSATKQIVLQWTAVHTSGVSIYVNEEEIVSNFTGNKYVINYQPQSGATYNIVVIPYNQKEAEGEEATEVLQLDQLETPYIKKVKQKSVSATDENGKYTGFQKPAAEIFWDGEENAIYEIYRGEKDKKSAYHYVGRLKTTKEGECSYLDKTISVGEYYYKIRKVVVEDEYISQEIATSLSEADSITITVPRAKLEAKLVEGNKIEMTLDASKDYVSGYEIYKKSGTGKYKKTATVTGNTWTDENITFGKSYKYKARAYYYDEKTKKKYYGDYSRVFSVKSTLGNVSLKANALTAKKVKISWEKVANADGYEVYFKSNVHGDGFRLLKTTQKLSFVKEFKKSGSYTFMVRAYKQGENDKMYYSSSEIIYQTGFTTPTGFKNSKTVYTFDKTKNTLVQKDTLTWDRVYGADGYYIERYNSKTKKYETITNIKKNSVTEYTLEHTVSKTTVTDKYRITAYADNKKLQGSVVKVKCQLGSTSKVQTKRNASKVLISWNAVEAAEKYNVYRSNGRSMVLVGSTEKTKLTDEGLSLGVTYTYYVQAVNETLGYQGEKSKGKTFTMPLSKVENFRASVAKDDTVTLKWSKASQADGYIIYYSNEKNGKYKKLAEVNKNNTSYQHKNPAINQEIYYKITAKKTNAGGSISESKASGAVKVYIEKETEEL